jgi:hypothetical protein
VLPRIIFVLGKGGVGRSTVSAALGLSRAARGERVLVLEWSVTEAMAPWFGRAEAGIDPVLLAPGLSVANYRLDAALRAYFVDHLRLGLFYRHIIDGPHIRRLIQAAPGIAELLFLGQLWWLTSLAEKEAGLAFDRIIVDAPATGHGASILELPATLATLGATGLLALEIGRVRSMMGDPAWTGTAVVALPDELSVEETCELVPRTTTNLGRRPLAAFVNRSASRFAAGTGALVAVEAARPLSPAARASLATLEAELRSRVSFERELRASLDGATDRGVLALDEQLAVSSHAAPLDVVRALAGPVGAHLAGAEGAE